MLAVNSSGPKIDDIRTVKTQVEFRSSKFPPYEAEQEEINPGLWGKRLPEYLVLKLSEKGISTNEIIPEDWGWYIPVKNDGFSLALCADTNTARMTNFCASQSQKLQSLESFSGKSMQDLSLHALLRHSKKS